MKSPNASAPRRSTLRNSIFAFAFGIICLPMGWLVAALVIISLAFINLLLGSLLKGY